MVLVVIVGLLRRRRVFEQAAAPHVADQRDTGTVGQVQVRRCVECDGVGPAPMRRTPMSLRCNARAPPAVAAHTASAGVMCISRTASAMQNGRLVV